MGVFNSESLKAVVQEAVGGNNKVIKVVYEAGLSALVYYKSNSGIQAQSARYVFNEAGEIIGAYCAYPNAAVPRKILRDIVAALAKRKA